MKTGIKTTSSFHKNRE